MIFHLLIMGVGDGNEMLTHLPQVKTSAKLRVKGLPFHCSEKETSRKVTKI